MAPGKTNIFHYIENCKESKQSTGDPPIVSCRLWGHRCSSPSEGGLRSVGGGAPGHMYRLEVDYGRPVDPRDQGQPWLGLSTPKTKKDDRGLGWPWSVGDDNVQTFLNMGSRELAKADFTMWWSMEWTQNTRCHPWKRCSSASIANNIVLVWGGNAGHKQTVFSKTKICKTPRIINPPKNNKPPK